MHFNVAFDEFIKEVGNQNSWGKATYEKFKAVRNHLKNFDKNPSFENDIVLPVISKQKMNDYLKELGESAEIDEPVRETYYKGNEALYRHR